ncbi:hypothetical protein BGY98DRAFT_935678 [Russula aff. rugulosa BPL654]|nr:hypothetical protein BGY98DRAFT_935678 [Russula aff. rugulosa BPL654]
MHGPARALQLQVVYVIHYNDTATAFPLLRTVDPNGQESTRDMFFIFWCLVVRVYRSNVRTLVQTVPLPTSHNPLSDTILLSTPICLTLALLLPHPPTFKRTKKDLLAHPLAAQLQTCDSHSSILSVLQQQVQELNQSQTCNERLTKWLDPTVNVLYTFSEIIGEGVSLVFSPAKAIFAGIGVLLSVRILLNTLVRSIATKDVRASQDALLEVFERIEAFFQRLEIYTKVAFNQEMRSDKDGRNRTQKNI